eukprot:11559-Heterococcus_DN1.PRE.2
MLYEDVCSVKHVQVHTRVPRHHVVVVQGMPESKGDCYRSAIKELASDRFSRATQAHCSAIIPKSTQAAIMIKHEHCAARSVQPAIADRTTVASTV